MANENGKQLVGTYVLGVFRGVSKEEYPKIHVGTFVRMDGSEFEERLQFNPFDPKTGAATLPEGLQAGQRVAVRLFLEAVPWEKDGHPAPFVSKRAIEVVALP